MHRSPSTPKREVSCAYAPLCLPNSGASPFTLIPTDDGFLTQLMSNEERNGGTITQFFIPHSRLFINHAVILGEMLHSDFAHLNGVGGAVLQDGNTHGVDDYVAILNESMLNEALFNGFKAFIG